MANEPFDANVGLVPSECFSVLINHRAGTIGQKTEMLRQKAVDLHSHSSHFSFSCLLKMKGYSLANEED